MSHTEEGFGRNWNWYIRTFHLSYFDFSNYGAVYVLHIFYKKPVNRPKYLMFLFLCVFSILKVSYRNLFWFCCSFQFHFSLRKEQQRYNVFSNLLELRKFSTDWKFLINEFLIKSNVYHSHITVITVLWVFRSVPP